MIKYWLLVASIASSSLVYGANSFYCSENHGYIKVGMTKAQVVAACGNPTSKKQGANSVKEQIPVVQLVYTTINGGAVGFYSGIDPVYSQWSLPSGSQGTSIQVNVINNKVASIAMNQQQTNAVSACQGGSFQIGDDISAVTDACGQPNIVNNSYMNQTVDKSMQPEAWTYDLPYQSGFTLTFIKGILQSIQQ